MVTQQTFEADFVKASNVSHHLHGARLQWGSTSTVKIGTTGENSFISDESEVYSMDWTGELTADMAVTGPGGLQTSSSEAADTWYKVLVIGDTTGVNTPKALLVPEGTAFSESGYDVCHRLGDVRNNGSSNFLKFFQVGSGNNRLIVYDETLTTMMVLSGGSATSYTDVDMSAFIPPSANAVRAVLGLDTSAANQVAYIRRNGSTVDPPPVFMRAGVVTTGKLSSMWSTIITDDSQIIEYKVTAAGASLDIAVVGYEDPLG